MKRLPALTQFYGLRPTDLDDMTYAEVSEYVTQMEKAKAEQPRGGVQRGR